MAAKRNDWTGHRFGRLVAVEYVSKPGCQRWRCVCDCGGEILARSYNLTGGHTTSCGCFKQEALVLAGKMTKHGMSRTPVYRVWKSMIDRCHNPATTNGKNYRDRGINVCAEWRDFEAFYRDMGDRPSPTHELDRRDNDGNYEPGNCRWITKKQNANNKRGNVVVAYRGRDVSIEEAAQMAGGIVGYATAIDRIRKRGWTVADAVETPPLTQAERFSHEARSGVLARVGSAAEGEVRKR